MVIDTDVLTLEPLVSLSSNLIKPASASCKPGSSSRDLMDKTFEYYSHNSCDNCPSSFKYHILLRGGVKRHTRCYCPPVL